MLHTQYQHQQDIDIQHCHSRHHSEMHHMRNIYCNITHEFGSIESYYGLKTIKRLQRMIYILRAEVSEMVVWLVTVVWIL